jgi:hypothetical protein
MGSIVCSRQFRRFAVFSLFAAIMIGSPGLVTVSAMQADATPVASEQPNRPAIVFEALESPLGYFSVEAEPGQTIKLSVRLGNIGDIGAAFRTYAADVHTMDNGGFEVLDSTAPVTDPTTWIDYPTDEIAFEPGQGQERTFTVTVPDDASPGQHIAGLAMETVDAVPFAEAGQGFQFDLVLRSALAVLITVPGPIEAAMELGEITMLQDTSFTLSIGLENSGNVLLKPAGVIRIVDAGGTLVVDSPVQMGTIYAGHSTVLSIGLTQPLPAGDYTVTAALQDEATGAKAELPATSFTIEAAESTDPVSFVSASVSPRPSADSVQLAEVTAVIGNTGDPLANLQVTLHVSRDGKLIESFPIATSLALPFGETTVQNRYLPLDGWSAGSWTFSLTLEQIDPGSGTSQQIATYDVPGSIDVP